MKTGLSRAINLAGGQSAIASIVGLTPQAIQKWVANGCMPRTEWTGETNYAEQIAQALDFKVTKSELLQRPENIKQAA